MTALEVYGTSDGSLTRAFYAELEKRGAAGLVAMNLFRAQKCSSRAKVYRGGVRGKGSYRGMAYERKQWSLDNLVKILSEQAQSLGIRWGWKIDHNIVFGCEPSWVLYVDLPQGQVSFHAPVRGGGPDYKGEWDREHKSAERIVMYAEAVYKTDERQQALL